MGHSTSLFLVCLLFCLTVYSVEAPCPPCNCGKDCPCGYVRDYKGCKTCQCKRCVECPPIACPAIACPCGHLPDVGGCPVCGCKPCPPPDCPSPHACPKIACPCGLTTYPDERGCEICQCRICHPKPYYK